MTLDQQSQIEKKKIISYAIVGFLLVVIIFSFRVLASREVIETLVAVIATVVGLFGVLAVYRLASYDERIGRLRTKIDEYKNILYYEKGAINYTANTRWQLELIHRHYNDCRVRQVKLRRRRQNAARIIKWTVISLLASLGFSFYLLNLMYLDNTPISYVFDFGQTLPVKQIVAVIALFFLGSGITGIFILSRSINSEYKQDDLKDNEDIQYNLYTIS